MEKFLAMENLKHYSLSWLKDISKGPFAQSTIVFNSSAIHQTITLAQCSPG